MQLTGRDASRKLLSPDWRSVIHGAATEEELVSVTRDYLACWSPEEIARLPVECRPGRVRDGQDIGHWAFELTSCHLSRGMAADDDTLVLKMMLFVNEAAERLARLQGARRAAEAAD